MVLPTEALAFAQHRLTTNDRSVGTRAILIARHAWRHLEARLFLAGVHEVSMMDDAHGGAVASA